MKPSAIEFFKRAVKAHEELFLQITKLSKEIELDRNLFELTDYAYALNEAYKRLDDIAHETKRLRERVTQIVVALWVTTEGEPIRTDYVTGIPDVKMMASVPSKNKDPEKYHALMEHLGVPKALYDGDNDVLRPHWPGLVDYVSELLSQGRPVPPGCNTDKLIPVYKLALRGKKGVAD